MTTAQKDRGPDGRAPGRPGPHDFLNVDAHLSEEQKERWLPPMARGEEIGASASQSQPQAPTRRA